MPKFVLLIAVLTLFCGVQAMAADDLSSMHRAGAKPDPMLSTSTSNPPSALSTDNMSSSNPMLSTTQKAPPTAITTAGAGQGVEGRLCQTLVKYHPSADVAYQPGLGSNGKKVAPADLPGQGQIELPAKFDIPITVNIAKAMNLNTSQYPYNQLGSGTESWIGTVSVEGDKVLFNGKPLSDAQQDNLAVLCMDPK